VVHGLVKEQSVKRAIGELIVYEGKLKMVRKALEERARRAQELEGLKVELASAIEEREGLEAESQLALVLMRLQSNRPDNIQDNSQLLSKSHSLPCKDKSALTPYLTAYHDNALSLLQSHL
jgi:hypothetical protein